MKKILNIILTMVMAIAMTTTVSAAKITVNGVAGHTYDAYKIFDVIWEDKNNDNVQDTADGYGYSISDTSEWYGLVSSYAGLSLTETAPAGTYTVTMKSGFDAASFATHLLGTGKANLAGKTIAGTGTISTGNTSVELDVSDPGYYLVNTSLGSLCILKNAAADITVNDKNSDIPLIDKTVKEDDTNTYATSNTAQIGQDVEFKATVTVKYNTNNYVLHDEMSDG